MRLWYGRGVKNITVSVPDEVYREARIRAAERGSSVSAMVSDYLRSVALQASTFARLEARQREIEDTIASFRAADRVGRDELHDRALR